jgi:hypothetical protein
VQLRNDNALGSINNERAVVSHIRDGTQEYILDYRIKVLMLRVGAEEFEFCLQGHSIGQSSLQALFDAIARRIDVIIQEFQLEIVASVRNREILGEHLIQTIVLSLLRWRVQLQEVVERL